MLWACEMKSRSWWAVDLNVVRICVELLHTLAVWLADARCQHHFITYCNLLYHGNNSNSTGFQLIAMNLATITVACLAECFIHDYIQNCAQLCSGFDSRVFNDVRTSTDLEIAVSAVIQSRLVTSPITSCYIPETASQYVTADRPETTAAYSTSQEADVKSNPNYTTSPNPAPCTPHTTYYLRLYG